MKIHRLEALRGFAAVYVILHHFIAFTFLKTALPAFIRFPFRFGQEAVILFFLMSGYVIYLSSIKNPEITFRKYFLRRFFRIYPIVICSFILSILICWINGYHFTTIDLKDLIGNIYMLQDTDNKPGSFILPFLHNSPLWSLSYEWWFYLLFYPVFILYYKKQKNTPVAIYMISVVSMIGLYIYLVYPNHVFLIISYFAMWWAGVETAEIYRRDRSLNFQNMFPVLLSIFIMTCFSIIPLIQSYLQGNRVFLQFKYPVLIFRHYLFAFIILIGGIVWYKNKWKLFDFIFSRFERFASISYAIYIIHFPVILLKIPVNPYLEILIKLILIFSLSYLLEEKMQPFINKIFQLKNKNIQLANAIK